MVPLGSELEHGAAKQVELHGHLGAGGRIGDSHQLVRGEYLVRVVHEVQHRDEVVIADGLQSLQGELALVRQRDIVPDVVETDVRCLIVPVIFREK